MDSDLRRIAAIIVAAGRGTRARDAGIDLPKQYRRIGGIPVLRRTIDALLADTRIAQIVCVIHPDDRALYMDVAPDDPRLLDPVDGGRSRQESVHLGLERLDSAPPDVVLVHDAVRPFVTNELIDRLLARLDTADAAIPALPVTDTVKRVDAKDAVVETVARGDLRTVQTPQAFRFRPLLEAHRRAGRDDPDRFTDDASIAEWADLSVSAVPGDPMNQKLTTAADIADADRRLSTMETRVGSGFDVHRFGPGSSVWLAGIEIPHDQSLVGHSDADVGLHTLTDAIFGALADGDIGAHFPPSDPQYKGATSDRFLAFATARVRERGGRILHLDLTLICERPKVGPHRDAMRARIAEIAGVTVERVAVKATTSERLGFTGRGEGIAATAVATLLLPAPAIPDTPPPGDLS